MKGSINEMREEWGRGLLVQQPSSDDGGNPPTWLSCVRPNQTMPVAQQSPALAQGLTLVHFSAQLKRFLRDRGYVQGLFRGCVGCVRGY